MRKIVLLAFTFLLVQLTGEALGSGSRPVSTDVKHWVEHHFAKGKLPPFSFNYGGKSSSQFLRNWNFSSEIRSTGDASAEERIYTYSDPRGGLKIRCEMTIFDDFQAVEWVLKISNPSGKNSPLLEKVNAADLSFTSEREGDFMLYHARGSEASRGDFMPIDDKLEPGKPVYLTPAGGRSSDRTAFPFFNLGMPGEQGIVVAVGWTGKWFAEWVRNGSKSVHLNSGMERMQMALMPGEEIRTPKICMLFWSGADRMAGHNQFRQFILAHHSRKINGQIAKYPLSGSFDYGDPVPCGEYECLTSEYAVALVNRYRHFQILPELFWLDAGWYAGCGINKEKGSWWQNVGNWIVDNERFPDGLKPVADAVHDAGAKFMVWFEPERVRKGSLLDTEHPGWLLQLPGSDNRLFDLGNPEACKWLIDYISEFLRKEGIDYYRQDFNFDPMPYWTAHDKPGRVGVSEIRHIEGLYAFWDSLLVRFPDLLIDNCASGGRRIDLETTSRSAPLWRTDYQYGEPNGYQCHTMSLNYYLPVHGTAIYKTDDYTFRSGLGATAVSNWEITGKNSESIPAIRQKISEFKRLRPYFYGDYYPLTPVLTGDGDWVAYQLDRPAEKDGIILAFRRNEAGNESIRVKPGGLDKNADYELFFEDYNLRVVRKGSELSEGLELAIPQKPASLLISYRKK